MQAPSQHIPTLIYCSETTSKFINIANILKRAAPPTIPHNNIPLDNTTQHVQNNNKFNVDPASEPRVHTPVLLHNNSSKPRVNPLLTPPSTPTLAPIPIPTIGPKYTPCPRPTQPPSIPKIYSPNPAQILTKYENLIYKQIVDALQNKHTTKPNLDLNTKIHRRKFSVPSRRNHFTRSRIQGFLAQNVVQINNHGYQHHIENHVYRDETGTK